MSGSEGQGGGAMTQPRDRRGSLTLIPHIRSMGQLHRPMGPGYWPHMARFSWPVCRGTPEQAHRRPTSPDCRRLAAGEITAPAGRGISVSATNWSRPFAIPLASIDVQAYGDLVGTPGFGPSPGSRGKRHTPRSNPGDRHRVMTAHTAPPGRRWGGHPTRLRASCGRQNQRRQVSRLLRCAEVWWRV